MADLGRDGKGAAVCVIMLAAPHGHFAAVRKAPCLSSCAGATTRSGAASPACETHERSWCHGVGIHVCCTAHTRCSARAQAHKLQLWNVTPPWRLTSAISHHQPVLCPRASAAMAILLVVGSRHMCLALELSGGRERRAVRDVADECNTRGKSTLSWQKHTITAYPNPVLAL